MLKNFLEVAQKRVSMQLVLLAFLVVLALSSNVTQALAQEFATPEFKVLWERTDKDPKAGFYFWGPGPNTSGLYEEYDESPGKKRLVQYFDKTRMEISDPSGDRTSKWFVTNGLLTLELITGLEQRGDMRLVQRPRSTERVAGDPLNNPKTPTYSLLYKVTSTAPGINGVVNKVGQSATRFIDEFGNVSTRDLLSSYGVNFSSYNKVTFHNMPDVFMLWFVANAMDWEYVLGLPITEPYWAKVVVGGVEKDVLIQAFERRVLTYTPSNDPKFRVEMGNVGQHYYRWRYGG